MRDEGLRSRSHGEEPHRYVTVYMPVSAVEDEDLDDIAVDVDEEYIEDWFKILQFSWLHEAVETL